VIIVNWNSGELLGQCLSALTEQSAIPQRIIVVDNASTDQSADGIETRYPNTKVIRLNRNTGFGEGNNIAIAEVIDCDWVALVNPDVFVEPN
jgi:GT2 family glycosyltransferase